MPLAPPWLPSPRPNRQQLVLPWSISKTTRAPFLADCFKQFGIDPVAVPANSAARLQKEKFEACVVRLGPGAQAVMEAIRTSASNSRMVIYGLGGSAQEAMRYSKYGINAIFQEPVERSTALKLVRATQMLVLHEFRRYIRIPVMTEVAVQIGERRKITATSLEVSSGGMSIKIAGGHGAPASPSKSPSHCSLCRASGSAAP